MFDLDREVQRISRATNSYSVMDRIRMVDIPFHLVEIEPKFARLRVLPRSSLVLSTSVHQSCDNIEVYFRFDALQELLFCSTIAFQMQHIAGYH